MPRYFFDVINGHGLVTDELGYDLKEPSLVQAEVGRIL
jgi:hypothetical protein